jgi:hypothetical protein
VMVWAGWQIIVETVARSWLADALAVGGLIPLAVVWYGWLLWELRTEGREEIAAWLRRRRGG